MSPLPDQGTNPTGNSQAQPANRDRRQEITPELVAKVAEKVYAMLLADMKLENERHRNIRNTLSQSLWR